MLRKSRNFTHLATRNSGLRSPAREVHLRPRVSSVLLVAFALMLFGCAISQLPSAEQYGMVRAGQRAVVLLRMTSEIDGEPHEAFGHIYSDDNFGLALGGFETGGRLRRIEWPGFLSSDTRKNGWMYFLLEPGTYYLGVLPPRQTNVWTYQNMFASTPLFRFDVPLQTKIIYVGTLHLPAVAQKRLFGTTISSFVREAVVVRDEENIAHETAAQYFPEFGTPKTMLIQPHQGPIILTTPETRVPQQ